MSDAPKPRERMYLVVIDSNPEVGAAVLYASLRVRNSGGRVALFFAIEAEPSGASELGGWMGVSEVMQQEAQAEAEITMEVIGGRVEQRSGRKPLCFIRTGNRIEQLLKLIEEEKEISHLVLAAAHGARDPGPIIRAVAGKHADQVRLPIIIVPGSLTRDEIEAIT